MPEMNCSKLGMKPPGSMKAGRQGPPPEIKAILDQIKALENKTTLTPAEQEKLDSLKASLPGKPAGGPKGMSGMAMKQQPPVTPFGLSAIG